ncbi:SLAM family member 8-like isoform X2 [Acipenser ruthenus]|uniref:SLAM family member 8-like isoform X2 n=1 Tax=Acipenser ruthenus TaxID=7906 RepID=UPI0027422967|nr:SLAM family member 8-like isoform X2 [Acipenser ruthenus]
MSAPRVCLRVYPVNGGHCLSESWSGVQQVKGIVGESLTFPVEIPNLPLDTEINWRYGPVGPDWPIARIQSGEIDAGFEERFTGRLQRDNLTNSLRITNLEREDSGFYQIEITGEVRLKGSMRLSVYDPVSKPHVTKTHERGSSGYRTCLLLCSVVKSHNVTLSWLREGEILTQTDSLNATELEISQEMQGGDVTYSCVASNPASNKTTTVTPSHYCDEKEGETTTIRPSTELIVRVLVFIVLSGVVIAVCVSVWKKINASSECRAAENRPPPSPRTDERLLNVTEEIQT